MGIWNLKSIHRLIAIAAALITFSSNANSQDLMGFDRASYGSVVLSQSQSAGSDLQLELSIGNYENEPIINYSSGSVFAQIGRSVGRLDVLTDKGVFPCTAFIVSEKHILTNYHCSKGLLDNEKIGASRIDATQFVAGYTQTGIEEGTKKYTVIPTPVEASKTLDYAVLEVIGDPSQEYGQLKLASTSPAGGDPFWIIGHPMGEGQRISREKCKANNPALSAGKLLHTCDTLPGNSGSPVIDAGLQQVVALHHAGSKADSVNFAILMSEILANSKVLTAFKAPVTVQQVAPKTAEITACEALYSAAAEAKACFAYEAYFKSCGDHSLAPIAKGYIKDFCQVEEADVGENAPETADVHDDEQLCAEATYTNTNFQVSWALASNYNAVREAKSRGLNCDVEINRCSSDNIDACNDKAVCKRATVNSMDRVLWDTTGGPTTYKYVTEAVKRGLACGVTETRFKIAFKNENVLRRKQLQYALKKLEYYKSKIDALYGPGTEKALTAYATAKGININNPERVFKSILSQVSVPRSFENAPVQKNAKLATVHSRMWHKKYDFSCSRAPNMVGDVIMNLNSGKNLLEFTIKYRSGQKLSGGISYEDNTRATSAKVFLGATRSGSPKTLKLKRSTNGKVSSFSFWLFGAGTCISNN